MNAPIGESSLRNKQISHDYILHFERFTLIKENPLRDKRGKRPLPFT